MVFLVEWGRVRRFSHVIDILEWASFVRLSPKPFTKYGELSFNENMLGGYLLPLGRDLDLSLEGVRLG